MRGSLFQNELLQRDYSPKFYAYYYKQWQSYDMPYHSHDSTEIMYMISGSCRIEMDCGSDKPDTAVLKKGDFILIDAAVRHRLVVDEGAPCRMLNVEFGFRPAEEAWGSISRLAAEEPEIGRFLNIPFRYSVMRDPEGLVYHVLKSLVLELDKYGRVGNPAAEDKRTEQGERRLLSILLFLQLLVAIARIGVDARGTGTEQREMYVQRCIDYLHQNYDRSIQVKDVAQFVNLHPGYLHRIFKRQTGTTLTAYLTNLRMEKAAMLLQQTDIPIHEISDYVGVGSRQYFQMLFKKHKGLTPHSYRAASSRNAWSYVHGSWGDRG
ncbi:AraC family transcriptional regulator [Paenibacillus sp. JX-17]|uniref:AraC family transcriptional regulator n=1 Tax=Paenibacillus lacisoli TaxID=3064525 RepID=A0ABT9CJW9_9BACL|nr:helix-turn-helix domain-containing protein [Paenibacillus sp. JX-17]MDO7908843.1 AraC family transcriptional regulator [Paenibacillus sp. JX-17]